MIGSAYLINRAKPEERDISMMLPNKPLPYRAQLLRMWVEPSTHRRPIWRFSLEDVETGKRRGFSDLDHLICHLLALMEEQLDPAQQDETGQIRSA
jgi:hypothetical protein